MDNITNFDLVIMVIVLLSTLLATAKGFTRSFFALFNWAVALFASYYLTPKIIPLVTVYVAPSRVTNIITSLSVYILSLLIMSQITDRIRKFIVDMHGGMLDSMLGVLFGFTRGMLFSLVIFVIVDSVLPIFGLGGENQPLWLKNSVSYPVLSHMKQWATKSTTGKIDVHIGDLADKAKNMLPAMNNSSPEIKQLLDKLPADVKSNIGKDSLQYLTSDQGSDEDKAKALQVLKEVYGSAMQDNFISSGEHDNAQTLINKLMKEIKSQSPAGKQE